METRYTVDRITQYTVDRISPILPNILVIVLVPAEVISHWARQRRSIANPLLTYNWLETTLGEEQMLQRYDIAQGAGRTEDEDMAELSQEDQQEVRIGEA